jgi:hypothetical protein
MSSTDITGASGTTASSSDTSTKDQAQQAAGTAADEGRHVAGVAAGEVKSVAGEAQAHAKGLLDEALAQVGEQTRTQGARAVSTLRTFSDDLESMASQSETGGLAADLARQAADRARTLGDHLDGREPGDLLDDVRRFARNRPGTFLIGALAAGVVAGRLARGAKDAGSTGAGDATGTSGTTGTTGTAGVTSTADTVPAASVPVTPATTAAPQYTSDAPTRTVDDPLGSDDPAIGSTIPPASPGRFEP